MTAIGSVTCNAIYCWFRFQKFHFLRYIFDACYLEVVGTKDKFRDSRSSTQTNTEESTSKGNYSRETKNRTDISGYEFKVRNLLYNVFI